VHEVTQYCYLLEYFEAKRTETAYVSVGGDKHSPFSRYVLSGRSLRSAASSTAQKHTTPYLYVDRRTVITVARAEHAPLRVVPKLLEETTPSVEVQYFLQIKITFAALRGRFIRNKEHH